jgi:hypothetical protein
MLNTGARRATLARLLLIPDAPMKSFLDRLKRKSAQTQPRKADNVPTIPETPVVDGPSHVEAPLAVKGREEPPADAALPPAPQPTAPAAKEPGNENSIELQLGDFLERIPPSVLKPGQLDRSLKLRFDLNVIAKQFTRSDPRIPLAEIYKRQPEIFCREVLESGDTSILLPWQKIIDMVMARKGGASPLPSALLTVLTQSLRKQRTAAASASSPGAARETQTAARPTPDASEPSWFSPKPMPTGALVTLPSTLRPPPTAAEAFSISRSRKTTEVAPNGRATSVPSQPVDPIEQELEQAAVTRPAPPPPRRASEVLGEQLTAITGHFARLVRQLEESAEAQAPVRAQHVPGLEHLIQAAEQKLAKANKEREAVVSLKAHLDSQFEALTFAQSGVATLQETLEAQSREFGRMQQVLQNVEEQLATMIDDRDALAAENAQLTEEISTLRVPNAAQSERELRDRIRELEARIAERPVLDPTLAQRSAARAVAHRERAYTAGCRPTKTRLVPLPACQNGLNGHQPAQKEASDVPPKKDRRHKRR